MDHPSDKSHGKGWEAIAREFDDGLARLVDVCEEIGATLVWIAHAKSVDIKTDFKDYTRIQVDLTGQAASIASAVPDYIWYCAYETEEGLDPLRTTSNNRVVYFRASEVIEAGTRDNNCPKKLSKVKLLADRPFIRVVQQFNKAKQDELQKSTQATQ